jgi:group I intron endonuclease
MNNKKYGVIYKITNIVNGKCYIGQTIKTIKQRFNKHFYLSKQKIPITAISKAIKKYGKENFIIEEIDYAIDEKV